MNEVYLLGVGMIRFGKYYQRTVKSMVKEAVYEALDDSGVSKEDLQAAWVGNAGQGVATGQESIRGQVALRPLGIGGIPMMNVDNACASGSSAVHGAWMGIRAGMYECALAVGMEKIANQDKSRVFQFFFVGTDVEKLQDFLKDMMEYNAEVNRRLTSKGIEVGSASRVDDAGKTRSGAMDMYSIAARYHMWKYNSTQRQLATIAAKNHWHSSMNPHAQYQYTCSIEDVIQDREVSWPLTRSMCAPIGDGAAAAVLCSGRFLDRLNGSNPVKIRSSVLASGRDRDFERFEEDISIGVSEKAYEMAGLGPQDIDLAEVHDATAFGELHQTETLGFCEEGQGGEFADSGATRLGGKIPINTSGGLESRGHPVGATGIAQMYELVNQLRGKAGKRQVENARIALALNGGGILGNEEAAMCCHILEG